MKAIGQYYYTYGAGAHPNRKLEFFRETSTRNVKAKAYVYDQATRGWTRNGTVAGADIKYESLSTTAKMQQMMEARQANLPYQLPYPVPISSLHKKQIDQVFQSLEPDGPYRLEITNGFSNNPKYEKVEKINIFNPS